MLADQSPAIYSDIMIRISGRAVRISEVGSLGPRRIAEQDGYRERVKMIGAVINQFEETKDALSEDGCALRTRHTAPGKIE